MADLTPREHEVMHLLAHGCTYKQVRASLGISMATLKNHVANVKRKAGLSGPLHRVVAWYVAQSGPQLAEMVLEHLGAGRRA